MLSDKLAILMTRHLTKEASGQEEKELMDLLTTAPEQQYFIDLLSRYLYEHRCRKSPANIKPDDHFSYIIQRAQDPDAASATASFSFACVSQFQKVKSKI